MEKVGAYTDRATEAGEWRPGSSGAGQSATPMLSAYFNMLQRELVGIVEAGGISLDVADDGQLLKAIRRLQGGAGTGFGHWSWSAGTAGDPGAGKVALNNADPSLATQVLLAEVSGESADYSMVLSAVLEGDTLYLQPRDGAALGHRFKVTGVPTDNGSYRSVPVAYISGSGGLPAANTAMLVRLVQTTAAEASTDGIAGSFSNLKASATGTNSTITVSADSVCVKNSAGKQKVLNGVALAINSAAVGANGLDTGVLAANTWYCKWVIYNPATQAVAGLLSLSATAPVMPAGFTHKARTGWTRTDGTANKYPLGFMQFGRKAHYVVAAGSNVPAMRTMASGVAGNVSTPTYVGVSVSPYVPPTASEILCAVYMGVVSGIAVLAPNASYGATGNSSNPPFTQLNVSSTGGAPLNTAPMPLESTNIYWASNNAAGYLYALGWEDNL